MSRNIKRLTHSEEFSNYYMSVDESEDLEHFGKLGMKWGQRLYQNKDGSLTPLGRLHYGVGYKRAKQMHEKGYALGDYEGYKSYKKMQKTSSYRDRGWKLKKEAGDSYNEDIVSDSAKRRATKNYYKDMHQRKPMFMALASKDDKQKISELAEKYANSEEYRRAKEFLDKHKDEFVNMPKEKKINIQNKELSKLSNEAANADMNGENKKIDIQDKESEKQFKSATADEFREQALNDNRSNRPVESDDFYADGDEEFLKKFGLTKNDLVFDDYGNMVRKDGKPFVYTKDGKEGVSPDFDNIAYESYYWSERDNYVPKSSDDYKGPSAKRLIEINYEMYDNLYRIRDGKGAKNGKPIGVNSKQGKALDMIFSNPKFYYNENGDWEYKGQKMASLEQLIKELISDGKVK